jgi:hypothetical protein
MSSPNRLIPSIVNEILTLQGSSLNIGHISSISLNAKPSGTIGRMTSSLLFHAK